jgi:hypothetical protein
VNFDFSFSVFGCLENGGEERESQAKFGVCTNSLLVSVIQEIINRFQLTKGALRLSILYFAFVFSYHSLEVLLFGITLKRQVELALSSQEDPHSRKPPLKLF